MSEQNKRRLFLGTVSTAAAVAAIGTVATQADKPTDEPRVNTSLPANDGREGYRLTEHIRRYYETTLS